MKTFRSPTAPKTKSNDLKSGRPAPAGPAKRDSRPGSRPAGYRRPRRRPTARPSDFSDAPEGVRLQKFIADCGVASRRRAESLMKMGEVTVNGKVIMEMGARVQPGKDAVKVSGKLILVRTGDPLYIKVFKPTKVLTTLGDPSERPTVKDLLTGVKERVFPAGRLDYDSEGLVIMTNDGEYAQKINHPENPLKKTYLVKIDGKPTPAQLLKLRMGVTLIDGKARVSHIEKVKTGDKYDWFKVSIEEGKNQQLQRMFHKVGFDVMKISRVAIGRVTLGKLQRGEFKIITQEEAELAFS